MQLNYVWWVQAWVRTNAEIGRQTGSELKIKYGHLFIALSPTCVRGDFYMLAREAL